jgi:hypothetical protein
MAEEKKECFGTIGVVTGADGQTTIQSKRECRQCLDVRDCIQTSKKALEEKKDKEELRKQEIITRIIDLSELHTNEIGSVLLEFLSRIYSSPLGKLLLDNLPLFYEIPSGQRSTSLAIPISRTLFDLAQPVGPDGEKAASAVTKVRDARGELILRVILIERPFRGDRKANMGLIAWEVVRTFSSKRADLEAMAGVLSDGEIKGLMRMDPGARAEWLMAKFGFLDELKALRRESAPPGPGPGEPAPKE